MEPIRTKEEVFEDLVLVEREISRLESEENQLQMRRYQLWGEFSLSCTYKMVDGVSVPWDHEEDEEAGRGGDTSPERDVPSPLNQR